MSRAWTHSWCKSPARDEAVRAAEDGRQGPLPTLERCIETARALMPKSVSASTAPEPENKANGMRTERVTLPWQREKWDEAVGIIVDGGEWGRGNGFHAGIIAALVIWADKTMVGLTAERDAAIRERDAHKARAVDEMPAFAPAPAIAGGTVLVNGQDMVTLGEFLRHTTRLTQEVGVARRERDAALRERDAANSQIKELERAALKDDETIGTLRADLATAQLEAGALRGRLEVESAPGLRSLANNLRDKLRDCEGALKRVEGERDAAKEECERLRAERDDALLVLPACCGRLSDAAATVVQERDAAIRERDELKARVEVLIRQRDLFRKKLESAPAASAGRYSNSPPISGAGILHESGNQPRGWLTAEEREAVEWFCGSQKAISTEQCDRWKDALCALLARSTPPEVEVPFGGFVVCEGETPIDVRDRQWKKALAAAGVKVKEVGK